MTDLRTAAQQALEFLLTRSLGAEKIIAALRAALEQQPEQALAKSATYIRGHDAGWRSATEHHKAQQAALRAALEQPEQELVAENEQLREQNTMLDAKLAELEAAPRRIPLTASGIEQAIGYRLPEFAMQALLKLIGASPPRREWKGLTEEEIDIETAESRDALMDFVYEHGTVSEGQQRFIRKMARAIEAALKERNA